MAEKRSSKDESSNESDPTKVSSLTEKSTYRNVDVPDDNPKPGPQVEQVPGKP